MSEFTLDIYKDNSGLWAFRAKKESGNKVITGVRADKKEAKKAGEEALKELAV